MKPIVNEIPNDLMNNGEIIFDNLSVKYRSNLKCAIRDVNVKIEAGEKVNLGF